jgi:hypothetical protein
MDEPIAVTKSGVMRYFKRDGRDYNLSHIICDCDSSTVTVDVAAVYPNGNLPVPATIHCQKHGDLPVPAMVCGLPFAVETLTARGRAIFAPMEERFHNDKRPQWGKVAHGGNDE